MSFTYGATEHIALSFYLYAVPPASPLRNRIYFRCVVLTQADNRATRDKNELQR
jgi:hypothetical protein